jgi:hypothetical protein
MSRLALNLMMLNFIFFLYYNQTLENTGNSDFRGVPYTLNN